MKEEIGGCAGFQKWHPGKKTVLLAEDDQDLRNLTKRILENAGYAVMATDNGYSALSLMQEFGDCIDVVLLDMNMPVMDGGLVLLEMRNRNHRIPVVIHSGMEIEEARNKCRKAQVSGFLRKPSSAAEVLEAVYNAAEGIENPG